MNQALDIIYEDNHLLILNKRAGTLVQGDQTGDISLVDLAKTYIKKKYQKPGNVYVGLVHRLDRPVSGLVIMTKTSKGLERMNALFRDRNIVKKYWAITEKIPEEIEGHLVHWLTKDRKRNIVKATTKFRKDGQKAELTYRTLSHIDRYYLLEINLLSGKFHQIRAQLSAAGCPIAGDVKYGYSKPNKDGSVCLHARELQFIHPVKKEKMILKAPLPEDLIWKSFKQLDQK